MLFPFGSGLVIWHCIICYGVYFKVDQYDLFSSPFLFGASSHAWSELEKPWQIAPVYST